MKLKLLFHQFDFLSKQPSLNAINQSRYRTTIGSLFSLIVIFTSLGFGLYFIIIFFKRKEINIVSTHETSNFYNGFNLSNTLFMFRYDFICYLNEESGDDDSLQTSVLSLTFVNTSYADPEQSYEIDVHYEPCSIDIIPETFRNKHSLPELSRYLCISPGQNITFNDNGIYHNYLYFSALSCSETFGHKNCKSKEYIENCYKETSPMFEIIIETDNTDHYNNSHPIQHSSYRIFDSKPPRYSIYDEVYFTVLNYETDNGYLFENIKSDRGIIINPGIIQYNFDINEGSAFSKAILHFGFSMNTLSMKYTRTYKKLQNVIADIGGIISLIDTIASFIVYIISKNYLYVEIANNVLSDKRIYQIKEKNNDSSFFQKSPSQKVSFSINDDASFNKDKSSLFPLNNYVNEKQNYPSDIKLNVTKGKGELKERKKQNFKLFTMIQMRDVFMYVIGKRVSKGGELFALSAKVTNESLSCEQLIKNDIYIQKIINSMSQKQKENYFTVKPEVIKEMEKKKLIAIIETNIIDCIMK